MSDSADIADSADMFGMTGRADIGCSSNSSV
jgi:hypothetical protein